ncbi:uncharacterized protein [Euphorbia lathyris]|uniref:uncharacterized protein n=1 Tax=Euphorbia lathyris TaxID=212925 RepID=UPI003313ABA5
MDSSMLKQAAARAAGLGLCSNLLFSTPNYIYGFPNVKHVKHLNLSTQQRLRNCASAARRRIVTYDEDEDEDEYGHNEEIAMLESYSLSATDEALIVQAVVDDQQVEVVIFKGYSSSLTYKTSSDPSRSVIPGRAVIRSIDRIKAPFHPSNIHYLEKGLSWESFKSRFIQT